MKLRTAIKILRSNNDYWRRQVDDYDVRGIKNGNAQELEDEYRDVAISFLENNKEIKNPKKY